MKYAVFSDLHGNIYALESMLQNVEGSVDGYIFLGDIFGYYTHQQECINALRKLPNLVALCGNHDRYYLDSLKDSGKKEDFVTKYGKSYDALLDESEIQYLEAMRISVDMKVDGIEVFCAHGGPRDYLEERIYPDQVDRYAKENPLFCEVYFTGHTHYPMVYHTLDGGIWVNPGSLGQPRDGCGYCYCTVDFEIREYRFYRLQPDKACLIREIEEIEGGSAAGLYMKDALCREKRNGQIVDVRGRW